MRNFGGRFLRGASVLLLFAALLATGCGHKAAPPPPGPGPQPQACPPPLSLEQRMDQRERLWNVSYALREANAETCGERTLLDDGVVLVSIDTVDDMLSTMRWGDLGAFSEMRRWREGYVRRYGLDARHRVVAVMRGSGGEAAGIRPGDVVTTVNGKPLPTGKLAARTLRWQVTRALAAGDTLSYGVERDGVSSVVAVRFRKLCNCVVDVEVRDCADVFSSGQGVHVSLGLLESFPDDSDLAALLGRELVRLMRGTRGTGGAVGGGAGVAPGFGGYYGLPGAGTLAGQAASEADALAQHHALDRDALFLMARAGYDYRRAAAAFETLAARPLSRRAVLLGETKPSEAEVRARTARLAAQADEIERLLAAGRPLHP